MSHRFDRHIRPFITALFISLCASVSLSFSLNYALLGAFPAGTCLAFCLAGVLLALIPGVLPRLKWLPPLLFIGAQGIAYFFNAGWLFELVQGIRALVLSGSGQANAILPWMDVLAFAIAFLMAAFCALIVDSEMNGVLLITGFSVLGAALWFTGGEGTLLLYALPFFFACLLQLTRTSSGIRLSSLPVAAALLLIAFLLAPGALVSQPLKEHADAVRSEVEDRLNYTGERSAFSLANYGYMPLETRLGGPADPSGEPVLQVDAAHTVYLRGVAYDTYTGRSWLDTLSARRYLYQASAFRTIRDQVFDASYPLVDARTVSEQVTVTLLADCATTVFAPQRFSKVELLGRHMILYFNDASELFLTRDLAAGDSYTFTYTGYAAEDPVTEQLIRACATVDDSRYESIAQTYGTLPAHLTSVDSTYLHNLAAEAAGSAQTPYEKALNIMTWLRANYTYTLDAEAPEEGIDFFAHFLVTSRTGYCTSFATAMTLLCRMEGIPARYVTGFLAVPENGTVTATGADAHAWTEIYLNGFGWLTMDATPFGSDNGPEDSAGDPDHAPDTPPSSSPTPGPEAPTPTPDPDSTEPEVTPTPTPTPTPSPSATPTPDPSIAPTVTPSAAPSAEPSDPPLPPDDPSDPPRFPWVLLLVLLLAALAALRLLLTEPSRAARRHPVRAATIAAAALFSALRWHGLHREKQETLREFFHRAGQAPVLRGVELAAAAAALEQWSYAGRRPDAQVLLRAYRDVRARLNAPRRCALALARLRPRRRPSA